MIVAGRNGSDSSLVIVVGRNERDTSLMIVVGGNGERYLTRDHSGKK